MIKINNNKVIVDVFENNYDYIKNSLTKYFDGIKYKLYKNVEGGIEFNRGLIYLLKHLITKFEDCSINSLNYKITYDYDNYRSLLNNISLRDDQIVSIIKSLIYKRGILQLATGSGKSLCIAGIIKFLNKELGYYPTTLIVEPSNYLLEEISNRFESYGIKVNTIDKNTEISDSGVYIINSKSISSIIKNNKSIFNKVKVLIVDEAHHLRCDTWNSLYDCCSNIEISLGFTAYFMDPKIVGSYSIDSLSVDELRVISCTGLVLLNITPDYYINKGILATPVLIRLCNAANEFVIDSKNWTIIRKSRLESRKRLSLILKSCSEFREVGCKILILSSNKKYSIRLLKELSNISNTCTACSFGSNEFVIIDNKKVIINNDVSILDKFKKGEINVLICTPHMFEGADISNLDVVILSDIGKSPRKVIQGIGRVLRSTKKYKYGFIIDFTDYLGGVLSYHSNTRLDYCRRYIGVKLVYNNVLIDNLKNILKVICK